MDREKAHSSLPDDRRHRHHHSHRSRSREKPEDNLDEQPEKKRHKHRHKHRHSRRSLSPGEVPPERGSSRSLSPGEIPAESYHRSKHREKRPRQPSNADIRGAERLSEEKFPPIEDNPTIHSTIEDLSGDSDEEIVGPMPASTSSQTSRKPKRALRRGEFGHAPEDIERYEQMGFVMSGNRRKRKTPSQGSTHLKSHEEKALKETELVARFKEMIQDRMGNEGKKE